MFVSSKREIAYDRYQAIIALRPDWAEEKAFYDILKALTAKYDFAYPEDKLLMLAQEVKAIVDDKAKYTDWSDQRSSSKPKTLKSTANEKRLRFPLY
jgi:hypothetical protein